MQITKCDSLIFACSPPSSRDNPLLVLSYSLVVGTMLASPWTYQDTPLYQTSIRVRAAFGEGGFLLLVQFWLLFQGTTLEDK